MHLDLVDCLLPGSVIYIVFKFKGDLSNPLFSFSYDA